jgi:hypothetical protein
MAPTKPLVHQQIESCYKVMGIPKEDTAEMTGNHSDSVDCLLNIPTEEICGTELIVFVDWI